MCRGSYSEPRFAGIVCRRRWREQHKPLVHVLLAWFSVGLSWFRVYTVDCWSAEEMMVCDASIVLVEVHIVFTSAERTSHWPHNAGWAHALVSYYRRKGVLYASVANPDTQRAQCSAKQVERNAARVMNLPA